MVTETYLIETNKKILERHRRLTGKQVWIGTTRTIDTVIPHVDRVGNSGNKIEDLIEKAVHLMCKIAWEQPFEDGNRRTGIISATKFLHDHGYEVNIELGKGNLEIREMLEEIKRHRRGLHVETMTQMSFYISKRMKLYES